ncbi:unnamed protein product [Schistosoma curassoni]|uniref:C1q domain-containing protein n=1 Tax=Schistosoma curassoni TaxID=6186 RepID=A0A3P7YDP5_9TREM|nr:unnamed protein product [Schistosoma curassoni]
MILCTGPNVIITSSITSLCCVCPPITFFLFTDINLTKLQLSRLNNQLQTVQNRIAFFAGLEFNVVEKPLDENPKLIMNKVITNLGNAYNPITGEFIAPINGIYILFLAISAQGKSRAVVRLMHNEKQIFDVWSESSPWATATNQGILQMYKGDRAWLAIRDGAYFLHGYMYSTFSGYLLFDINNNETIDIP